VAETPFSKFRLGEHTLADLDALAAGLGGVRSAAVRDAIHYWRQAVEEAGARTRPNCRRTTGRGSPT
jgi:hypothetical protein